MERGASGQGRLIEVSSSHSRQNFLHHISANIRQSEIATLEMVGQLRVIEAKQVKNGRVQIMHVDRVDRDVESKIV